MRRKVKYEVDAMSDQELAHVLRDRLYSLHLDLTVGTATQREMAAVVWHLQELAQALEERASQLRLF